MTQVTVMSADSYDDFEYRPASEYTSEDRRRHYWAVAIGLQDVDGLKVSDYLRDLPTSAAKRGSMKSANSFASDTPTPTLTTKTKRPTW